MQRCYITASDRSKMLIKIIFKCFLFLFYSAIVWRTPGALPLTQRTCEVEAWFKFPAFLVKGCSCFNLVLEPINEVQTRILLQCFSSSCHHSNDKYKVTLLFNLQKKIRCFLIYFCFVFFTFVTEPEVIQTIVCQTYIYISIYICIRLQGNGQ